jgi:hypothetical protein
MRELHAVSSPPAFYRLNLKTQYLLFDRLQVVGLRSHMDSLRRDSKSGDIFGDLHLPNCEFLSDLGFLVSYERGDKLYGLIDAFETDLAISKAQAAELIKDPRAGRRLGIADEVLIEMGLQGQEIVRRLGLLIRYAACEIEASGFEAVPIGPLPSVHTTGLPTSHDHQVLHAVSNMFPEPDDGCAWQDVIDFKFEMADKLWHFRRFLHTLATKKQTETEIRDDIDWTLNEYTKAMTIHHLKAGDSFLEVYVMPVIELVEDLAKLNWSKIAKGFLSVEKRQVELMEAEMKAPGRECAYVFEAQKRFGSHH